MAVFGPRSFARPTAAASESKSALECVMTISISFAFVPAVPLLNEGCASKYASSSSTSIPQAPTTADAALLFFGSVPGSRAGFSIDANGPKCADERRANLRRSNRK